jgi:hypothetical protein
MSERLNSDFSIDQPLLKRSSFYSLRAKLIDGTLRLRYKVTKKERNEFCVEMGIASLSMARDQAIQRRPPTQVELVNEDAAGVYLTDVLSDGEVPTPASDTGGCLSYLAPTNFRSGRWQVKNEAESVCEGQDACLVAYRSGVVVGAVGLNLVICHSKIKPESDIQCTIRGLYVTSEVRDRGVAFDLSLATAMLVHNLVIAEIRTAPIDRTLNVSLRADHCNEGCMGFMSRLFSGLSRAKKHWKNRAQQKSVILGRLSWLTDDSSEAALFV